MAWPISLLYGMAVNLRNVLYDIGFYESMSYETPTVCIGNLSVGGTGKTPMIEFLLTKLEGFSTVAVLSRGYKRSSKGFQMAGKEATVEQLGDEPFQISQKFPQAIVAVDADRQNGISMLEKTVSPNIILLDDAFQHRKVTPKCSVLLTTYADPFYRDWYLPTGNLRDAKSAARRADIIVVTKCPTELRPEKIREMEKRLRKRDRQIIVFAQLQHQRTLCGYRANDDLSALRNKKFTLVTGIANPQPLVDYLRADQLHFDHLQFADHHAFRASEIALLNGKSEIVTTEKDYVRLRGKVEKLSYIKVGHQFLDDGEHRFFKALYAKIRP